MAEQKFKNAFKQENLVICDLQTISNALTVLKSRAYNESVDAGATKVQEHVDEAAKKLEEAQREIWKLFER